MKSVTKNSSHSTFCVGCKVKYLEETVNVKFFGLQIGNHLHRKNHIEQMIRKFSGTCYAVRLLVHFHNIITHKSIYYPYFYSIIIYGIIF